MLIFVGMIIGMFMGKMNPPNSEGAVANAAVCAYLATVAWMRRREPFRSIMLLCFGRAYPVLLWASIAFNIPWTSAETVAERSPIVALWLFDESFQRTTLLTDAGPNYWDLRLNTDYASLVPGRFGNSLRPGHKPGIATLWAMGSRPEQSRLNPFPYCPRELVRLLAGEDWTLEFWLRFDSKPDEAAVILSAGPKASGSLIAVSLERRASSFVLRGRYPRFEVHSATNPTILTDGHWHHVAFVFNPRDAEFHHFLDGESQFIGMLKSAKPAYDSIANEGIIVVEHADLMQGAPINVYVINEPMWHSGGKPGSRHYTGEIRVPVSKEFTFTVDADDAVCLEIDGTVLIERCTEAGPTSGTLRLESGKSYEFDLTTFHPNKAGHHLSIHWSWPGQQKQVIPASAFTHRPNLFEALSAEATVYRHAKEEGFVFSIGSDLNGGKSLPGEIDELCFSQGLKYNHSFVPTSLAPASQQPATPSGRRPLALDSVAAAFDFGNRKHVFIDDMLVERLDNVAFRVNPPVSMERTNVAADQPWEFIGEDSGSSGISIRSCYDFDDKVCLIYVNDGIWHGIENVLCLAESTNGLHFSKPSLNQTEWRGTNNNNIISLYPGQGSFIVDRNPSVPASERIKFFSFGMERGVHVFTSSDGRQFVRNGVTALAADIGGGVEPFWDDQRGEYGIFLRHEGFLRGNRGADGRAAFFVRTRQLMGPWDVPKLMNPAFDKITEEFPVPFQPNKSGQVYRTRVVKYEWAPDVFLAFPWRMLGDHVVMQTELATSRNGLDWNFHGIDPAYLSVEGDRGKALATHGLVRRGDEIWQYADVQTSEKSDIVRVVQRLDGFTCFSVGAKGGVLLTKPLIFSGNELSLNVAARGRVRVAIVNPDGSEIPGFGNEDCQPVEEDTTRACIKWHGSPPLSSLAGYIVRLKFEMKDADLYAFEFQ